MAPVFPQSKASEDAAQARFGAAGEARVCDHPACTAPGLYRAPRDRSQPGAFYWFCLEPVRDYNRSWDWFAGMSEAEIEAQRRRDQVWDRPTWSFAGGGEDDYQDPFDLFAEERAETRRRRSERRRRARGEEELALAELDLGPGVTLEEVKIRYKFLAKQLHPDANGGDPEAEERLKSVNQAYATLKNLYLSAAKD